MQQLSLFTCKSISAPPKPKPATFSAPVAVGERLSIHGLRYSLTPVAGWVEVEHLTIYRPPRQKCIAERAWVLPGTIVAASCDAWGCCCGFGPRKRSERNSYEMACFDFVSKDDRKRVEEILDRKIKEHNDHCWQLKEAGDWEAYDRYCWDEEHWITEEEVLA